MEDKMLEQAREVLRLEAEAVAVNDVLIKGVIS